MVCFVFSGNPQSLDEEKNPFGTSSSARFYDGNYVYLADVSGYRTIYGQNDNFRVGTYDQMYPKLHLTDDVTTWLPGTVKVSAPFYTL